MHQKFAWTKKYSVGVAEIDKQHKEFIKICNGLLDLAKEKSFTLEEVKIKIMRLGDYALYHFGTEEELFIKTKYPDASPHTKAHLQFRDKVKDYIKHAQQKIMTKKEIEEVANFAAGWILNHILIMDKKYSEHFKKQGIK